MSPISFYLRCFRFSQSVNHAVISATASGAKRCENIFEHLPTVADWIGNFFIIPYLASLPPVPFFLRFRLVPNLLPVYPRLNRFLFPMLLISFVFLVLIVVVDRAIYKPCLIARLYHSFVCLSFRVVYPFALIVGLIPRIVDVNLPVLLVLQHYFP